eukprot:3253160-Pyramimonas_sp.AAC.1
MTPMSRMLNLSDFSARATLEAVQAKVNVPYVSTFIPCLQIPGPPGFTVPQGPRLVLVVGFYACLLYTSDAADDTPC